MEINNGDGRAKVLAYYLPQFYPCEFNDKWYGKGFTEWTNVGKAKPLFKGHLQPRVPSELGYYDLRVPEVAEKQVELAREAGVFGFAYWHYWWAGEMLLNMPAERLLASQKPDYPFMFSWANENWFKKLWDKDTSKDTLIREQTYPGEADNRAHFDYCLPFFKDTRYLTYDGKPMFMIYHPLNFLEVEEFMNQWDRWIKEEGVADCFYWMAVARNSEEVLSRLISLGFNCVNFNVDGERLGWNNNKSKFSLETWKERYEYHFKYKAALVDYTKMIDAIWVNHLDSREDVAPVIIPQWDHSPRSGNKAARIYNNATPDNFYKLASNVLSHVKNKKNKIVMLKSWNEWAEGNYMEPDLTYGRGYIEALGKAVEETKE